MIYKLKVGRKLTGVTVRQDTKYPKMWRVHYGKTISDMVNLARAKDAALTWWRPRGLGGEEIATWAIDCQTIGE
jgi:hypothetical protein